MNAIIIEDEHAAVHNLKYHLSHIQTKIKVSKVIDTVTEAINHLRFENNYDIIFMDIHLADGNSFEILSEIKIFTPIIFITAFDQYAIQAFKVNSVDYLLKPIRRKELEFAIQKFLNTKKQTAFSLDQIEEIKSLIIHPTKKYRKSFLIQMADTLTPIAANAFAFFRIKHGQIIGETKDDLSYPIDGKLEDLEKELDPSQFFRVNRQYIIGRSAIQNLSIYFNGRLIVNIVPSPKEKIIVSRANASKLRSWLSRAN